VSTQAEGSAQNIVLRRLCSSNARTHNHKAQLNNVCKKEFRNTHARAKEKNLSPSYIRTLERLKAHWEKEQEITSEAK